MSAQLRHESHLGCPLQFCDLCIQAHAVDIDVLAGVVLLHADDSRVDTQSERFEDQGLVAFTSLHLDRCCRCALDLAAE